MTNILRAFNISDLWNYSQAWQTSLKYLSILHEATVWQLVYISTQKYYARNVMYITGMHFKIKFAIESEAYSELWQTSKVVSFAKIVNGFKKITIFERKSILEILDKQDSEYASANIFQLSPKSTFYCWTFESIETSSHFLLLEIQITIN